MKIALVANTSWNIFNFRSGLVKALLRNGHEVIVLAPKDQYSEKVEAWGAQYYETRLDQTGTNPFKDLGYCLQLIKVFRTNRPDIILSFTIKSNIYSSLGGRWVGIPVICNVSGLGTVFLVKGLSGTIAIMLYRLAFRFSSLVFFQNEDDKELFTSHIKLDKRRIGLLPGSGIDLKRFTYTQPQVSTPTKFLMVSRVIEEKGVREFVEAARLLKGSGLELTFTLIGNHDEGHSRSITKAELNQWVDSKLINYLPHTLSIKDHMISSEVIVLPSYREGMPRTLLEGAALGRALLASNVPGCKEIVDDGYNGFLFSVRDPQSLVNKIKLYCALTNDERLDLAKNSRKLVEEKFDEQIVINRYIEAIRQIVDN